MQQFVLKEQIRDKIAGRKVVAALFYTFNFDPVFFENYIMPLLVPGKDFRDEMIYNKILWRHCLREGIIPPTTVYCDFFAKNNTHGPSLGYSIHCLSLSAAPGYISNFHLKHIFLLVEDKDEQSLLMFTGSGNITTGGWCENFEVFSVQEFKRDNTFPRTVNTNRLQNIISTIAGLKPSDGRLSEAEQQINNFLRYVDFNEDNYFNSTERSFTDFLEQRIFSQDSISNVEIVSPYFSEDTGLLQYLKNRVSVVKCLIPSGRHNEIQLNENLFVRLQEEGLIWCQWKEYKEDGQIKNRDEELRSLHAKIYILHSNDRTYTIVGSVNFTHPAWKRFSTENNQANIEAAWLYANKRSAYLLAPKTIDINAYRFIDKQNQDQSSVNVYTRNIPEIDFVLNWEARTLEVRVRLYVEKSSFHNILNDTLVEKGVRRYDLSPDDYKRLTKNTLVQIKQSSKEGDIILSYYVQQEKINAKPLDFKMDITDILRYWSMLGDEYGQQLMSRNYADMVTDESGMVNEDKVKKYTLLNEMAAHFNALIKLERYIFSQSKTDLARTIQYYLLSENVDTLSFYLRDLETQSQNGSLLDSFYWMILQILRLDFYGHALKKIKMLRPEDIVSLKKDLRRKMTELDQVSGKFTKSIDMSDPQRNWILKQLATNNE